MVGAGFIGCEVAASLRGMGVDVVLVEPQPTPLASVLGEQIGELVTRLHRAEGVDVRCGVGVTGVTGVDHVEKVMLSDGTETGRRSRGRRHRLRPVDRLARRQSASRSTTAWSVTTWARTRRPCMGHR